MRQMPQWICVNVEIILLIPNLLSVYPRRIVLYSGWVPEEQKTDWLEMKALSLCSGQLSMMKK